jgi:lipopolysaccharide transport system permease protein
MGIARQPRDEAGRKLTRCAAACVKMAGRSLGQPQTTVNPAALNAPLDPHASRAVSPAAMLGSLWSHRELIAQMTRREVIGRYRGSVMGLLWSFLNPVFMLAVYTFAFSVAFRARWPGQGESHVGFALIVFAGMIVHALFAEVLNRAPTLVLANVNYVKKVVFPLEILAVVGVGAALFHALVSLAVLVAAWALVHGELHWTALLAPLVVAPLGVLALGFGWLLSSLGVFVRDIGQLIGLASSALMFLSPVFYPLEALPAPLRPWLQANPLTFIIGQVREVLVWGRLPDVAGLGLYLAAACVFAWLCFAWFQKTRKGFADVL